MALQVPVEQQQTFLDALKYDDKGLVSVIIQDADNGQVLMFAFANREAISNGLRDGKWWFYSRSRQKLWLKGESSGNFQHVVEVRHDCDADALLVKVRQDGGACHKGFRSCFAWRLTDSGEIVEDGEKVFDPEKAYGNKK
jgi:phosphoribosyl-AMP cyclohydrolase